LVHQLERKYAANKDQAEKNNSDGGSSIEEELEFVDAQQESDGDDDDDDDNEICDRNGYYSPIDEEKDEWILKLQNQRKRKVSSPYTKDGNTKRKSRSSRKIIKTPVGKKLVRRKSTPTKVTSSSATPSASARKRSLTIQEDSSDDDIF